MNTGDITQLEALKNSKNCFLKVEEEGLHQRLKAVKKGWFGRLWMWIGFSSASMSKVAEYIRKNQQSLAPSQEWSLLQSKMERYATKHFYTKKIRVAIEILKDKNPTKPHQTPIEEPHSDPNTTPPPLDSDSKWSSSPSKPNVFEEKTEEYCEKIRKNPYYTANQKILPREEEILSAVQNRNKQCIITILKEICPHLAESDRSQKADHWIQYPDAAPLNIAMERLNPLQWAVVQENKADVEKILQDPYFSSHSASPDVLSLALQMQNDELFGILLKDPQINIRYDIHDKTIFSLIAQETNSVMRENFFSKLFDSKRVLWNQRDRCDNKTPFDHAKKTLQNQNSVFPQIEEWMKKNCDDNLNSKNVFDKAISDSDSLEVANLISQGYDVNLPNTNGITPLMTAITKSRLTIAKKLLEAGANPNALNSTTLYTSFTLAIYRMNQKTDDSVSWDELILSMLNDYQARVDMPVGKHATTGDCVLVRRNPSDPIFQAVRSKDRAFVEYYQLTRTLATLFGDKIYVSLDLPTHQIAQNGGNFDLDLYAMLNVILKEFIESDHCQNKLSTPIRQQLLHCMETAEKLSANHYSNEEINANYVMICDPKNTSPIPIPTGWSRHATAFCRIAYLTNETYYFLGNRGDRSKGQIPGLRLYKNSLSERDVGSLLNNEAQDHFEKLTENSIWKKEIPTQKVGNCVWASSYKMNLIAAGMGLLLAGKDLESEQKLNECYEIMATFASNFHLFVCEQLIDRLLDQYNPEGDLRRRGFPELESFALELWKLSNKYRQSTKPQAKKKAEQAKKLCDKILLSGLPLRDPGTTYAESGWNEYVTTIIGKTPDEIYEFCIKLGIHNFIRFFRELK